MRAQNKTLTHLVTGKVHRARACLLILFRPTRRWRSVFLLSWGRTQAKSQSTDVPVLERLVETTGNEPPAVRSESDAVNTVSVPSEPLDQSACLDVPYPDHSVQTSSSDVTAIRCNGNTRHACIVVHAVRIVDRKDLRRAIVHIPDTSSFVTRTADDETTIAAEIEAVDLLLMTVKDVADATLGDIPDADLLVLRASSEELAIRREANRTDVQIARFSSRVVGKNTESRNISM